VILPPFSIYSLLKRLYLEIFIAESLVADGRERETMRYFETGVSHESQKRTLGYSKVREVDLVAMLDKLHDNLTRVIWRGNRVGATTIGPIA